ncbi:MAG TPA: alpha-amylase family glycosyl hydrolase [Holophagaceae bacterium]|nr:alpha-amylase family glycosyl hydrolase [Holophagaceae bacterium]
MNRPSTFLMASGLVLLFACGGGGGGGGTAATPAADAMAMDRDANATPPADPAYFKVPSQSLGAIIQGGNVTFNYWNPNAGSVTLCLYSNWNDALTSPAATVAMSRGSGGIWSTGSIPMPAQAFYVYRVGGSYVLDPYAKSMAQWVHANGSTISGDSIGKGAVIDPGAILPDGGWAFPDAANYFDGSRMRGPDGTSAAPYAYASNRDAVVYEAGIRDLTVDPNLGTTFANGSTWGTYKGLVTMLPHIQKLGVTHIQLLCPLANYNYDQTKRGTRELDITKTSGANYNWGYDPQNYFTPSGMYSADPQNPALRVNELKTLINEIHKRGMGVILDVVYNHTANNNVLGDSGIQGYFYRSTSRNGAGSQDVRSDAKMVRKLILDSVLHWVGEYKVDGFRFDLMGVLDSQTIKTAYTAAKALNPNVLFLGEGWNGYYSGVSTDYNGDATSGTDQANATQFSGMNVAMFSDSYRQIFKNGYPTDGAQAFLSGLGQSPASLFSNVSGRPTNGFVAGSTNNVASYLTCHDNLCLYDVLAMATNVARDAAGDAEILKRAKIGHAVLLTSQGLAFLHAGDEMFRTKETTGGYANTKSSTGSHRSFVDNSYNASDAINLVKWSTVYSGDPIAGGFANYDSAANGYQLYAYVQGLLAIRKSSNAFRLPDAAQGTNLIRMDPVGAGSTTLAFGYKCVASTSDATAFLVFHNAGSTAQSFNTGMDLSTAALLADGVQAGLTPIPLAGSAVTIITTGGLSTVTLPPLTSAIIRK